jgi:hypothetical protein
MDVTTRLSGLEHYTRPVSSGRRLALTYNLVVATSPPENTTSNSPIMVSRLQELLRTWKDGIENNIWFPTTLAQILDHRYSEYNLSFDKLKGRDRLVVSHLREACDALQIPMYL